jgi:hypothetical protein
MEGMHRALPPLLVAVTLSVGLATSAFAQDPQSAAPARDLAQQLSAKKLDSFAVRLPNSQDEFAAVLAFPGQMVVVWARFSAPAMLNEKIIKGEYREVYIDLNSASDPQSRNIVTDLGSDGVRRGAKNQPSDAHDVGNTSVRFDGSWREDKMSEKDYMKAHADADAAYTQVLGVLLEGIKKAG